MKMNRIVAIVVAVCLILGFVGATGCRSARRTEKTEARSVEMSAEVASERMADTRDSLVTELTTSDSLEAIVDFVRVEYGDTARTAGRVQLRRRSAGVQQQQRVVTVHERIRDTVYLQQKRHLEQSEVSTKGRPRWPLVPRWHMVIVVGATLYLFWRIRRKSFVGQQ